MDEENNINAVVSNNEDITKEENNTNTIERNDKKEELEARLSNLKVEEIKEAIALHCDAKKALKKQQIDENYLRYLQNSIEDKIFCDKKFDKISPKVLLEIVCPSLQKFKENKKIEKINIEKLEIDDIGEHFENEINYIDKICVYENSIICVFGVNEKKIDDAIKYERRKFIRQDMIEVMQSKYEESKEVELEQFDEYYVGIEPERVKVYSERKIVALVKVEETTFDKIKTKLAKLFNINPFAKKKFLPNLELVYDTNPNRLKEIEKSKVSAKNRMKVLLQKEREQTRVQE